MDKQQAQNRIEETFEKPFDKTRFTVFVKNLLNKIDESKAFHAHGDVKESFKTVVKTYERLGTYTSPNGEKIDILIVYLHKTFSIHHARVTQRNFAGKYLADRGQKDAGLFAFVSPDNDDWRFSLVKMDYRFEETPTGKMKVKEEFTPARRWSFLVGANERSHTAQSRLVKILAEVDRNPTLAELEEAFNIETVTKEFFFKYRDLFIRTKEEMDQVIASNAKARSDFEAKGVNTVDFAKKLLGQIVFLYFLQKKGWFGAGRDADWGEGSKQFLRELFEKKHSDYANFFDDILEPLFYEALRNDRSHDDHYYSRFKCKIPFLNGGLFDPIGNYDWVHTDIFLPDDLFSNSVTKDGDTGNGILDIFDRYNFTVKEDEPLEKEVAIDPELLGKAYEKFNAIRPDNFEEYKKALKSGKKGDESKFNKQYGVYYTPREIVHFMCQQSLINYLHTELNDTFIAYEIFGEKQYQIFGNKWKKGQLELTQEHRSKPSITKEDIETLILLGEQVNENDARVVSKGKETDTYFYKIPESIRKNAELIDQMLADITICDPAVGSGAFPVGIMSEIVKARTVLSTFIENKDGRTSYNFKRRCIEHSLYGVDIDPGAVEIAKLRLWLSLVVDEDDIKNIKPLPNLDYKIVCGNSLLGYPYRPMGLDKIEELKAQFFNETRPAEKRKIKDQIDQTIYEQFKNSKRSLGYKVTMDFQINFSEVFNEKGGFDVVIANPPYVRQEAIKPLKPHLTKAFRDFYCGTADIYTYFYKCGVNLLKTGGHLCFIAPNKFMRAGYGENTRVLLTTLVTPKLIVDFGDLPIFEATTYPSIVLVEKRKPDIHDKATAATFNDEDQLKRLEETINKIGFYMPVSSFKKDGWNLEQPEILTLMEKLRSKGTPLGEYVQNKFYYGIKTGLNEAFVIDAATREKLIADDPKSAELIKPWLRGKDIRKWRAEWSGLYLIHISSSANKIWPWSSSKTSSEAIGLFESAYPSIYHHLFQWKKQLQKRDDQGKFWWELRSCVYYSYFERPKIVYPDIAQQTKFTWDESKAFLGNTAYIIPTEEQWLVGLLNSNLIWWFYINLSSTIRGGFVRFIAQYMEQLPIPSATAVQRSSILKRTRAILAAPDSPDVPKIEREIDRIIYELYGLTEAEIKIVEGRK